MKLRQKSKLLESDIHICFRPRHVYPTNSSKLCNTPAHGSDVAAIDI
jgi:hypothetical protein